MQKDTKKEKQRKMRKYYYIILTFKDCSVVFMCSGPLHNVLQKLSGYFNSMLFIAANLNRIHSMGLWIVR